MKKYLLVKLSGLLFIMLLAATVHAQNQSLKLVPNPDSGLGYQGSPVAYNNDLYFAYTTAASGTLLGQYDGDTITFIPNPAGCELVAPILVYNDTLYLEYYNRTAGVYQLAKYGGNAITLVPNPSNASTNPFGIEGIYNNKLYFEFTDVSYNLELAQFDGSNWVLFYPPVPGAFTFQGGFITYNNKLYMGFQTTANVRQMMQFDGTSLTLIPNPDGATAFSPFGGGYQGWPIIYNNDLYIKYVNINGITQLAQYNGTTLSLIPNPDAGSGYGYGSGGFPVVYNNDLYIQYLNGSQGIQLAQYNGTALSLIANPDGGNGFQGAPIVYNNDLYMQYLDINGIYRLAQYDGTALTLISNPQASPSGYANYTSTGAGITPPFVFAPYISPTLLNPSYLYIQYQNIDGFDQLAAFNDSLSLVTNPDTSAQAGRGAEVGYKGSNIVYDNRLYVQYYNASSAYQLAYLSVDTLSTTPVTWLGFTAQQQGNNAILQWQTAVEVNSNYFNIQRSTDDRDFTTIGKVNAGGNSKTSLNYSYIDQLPDNQPVIYYRLQEVDKNGRTAYSDIAILNINTSNGSFTIVPNPVKDIINLYSAISVSDAGIVLQDMSGKILYSGKQDIQAGDKIQLPVSSLAKGMYILTIQNNTANTQLKVIKGE